MDEILSREKLMDAAKCREKSACKFCNNYDMALESCCILTCIEASAKTALYWQDEAESQAAVLEAVLVDAKHQLERCVPILKTYNLYRHVLADVDAAIAKIDGLEVGKE